MGYIYLASPYSAPTLQERVNRFMAAQARATALIQLGFSVYSPIVHWHHIALITELPIDFEFWQKQNDDLLSGAGTIEVMAIPGYKTSRGVRYELERARKEDKGCQICLDVRSPFRVVELELKTWTPDNVLSDREWYA